MPTPKAELEGLAAELTEAVPSLSVAQARELHELTESYLRRMWPLLNDKGRADLLATGWLPPN